MIASWGLLAFLKAADTRQNASFAIKLDKKGTFDEYENELRGEGYDDAEEFLREADMLNPQRAPERMPERTDKSRHTRRTRSAKKQDTRIRGRSAPPERQPIKYQDFDSFLDDNLMDEGQGQPYDPLTLDDLFGGDKK